jgi:hypothetical protein
MTDLKRARVIAARAERDRLDLQRDETWLAWMRTKPRTTEHDELLAVLRSLDARILRKGREIDQLQGREPARFAEAVP